MDTVSLVGILVAISVLIFCSMKGISLIISSSISAMIITVSSGLTFAEGYGNYYMSGVGGFVTSMLPLFLGGLFLGGLLEHSGLATSIADGIVKVLGEKNIIVAVYAATYLMSLAGISVFVIMFTMYPLAVGMFKKGNLPRKLIPGTIIAAAVAYQCLPGIPIAINVLASDYFEVNYMSGTIIAVIASVIVGIGDLLYLMWEAKRCRQRGEGYEGREEDRAFTEIKTSGRQLNAWMAAIPMGVVFILMNVVGCVAWLSVYVGVIVMILICRRHLDDTLFHILGDSAKGSINVIITGSIVGLGSLVAATPGYNIIAAFLETYSGNPYIYAFVAVAVIAAITGSATGGVKFALSAFGDKLVSMGGNPAALSRIITLSSLTFDSLPHNGSVVLALTYCGIGHKEGYKYMFVTTVISTLIAAFVGIAMATMGIV